MTEQAGGGIKRWDIHELSLESPNVTNPLVTIPRAQGQPEVSPDGRWLVYTSGETGTFEVYVQPFHSEEGRTKISTVGGSAPIWSPDGSKIYYRNEREVIEVPVSTEPTFSAGMPKVLFEGDYFLEGKMYPRGYDLAPDGSHFVMIRTVERTPLEIHFVLNWLDELEHLVPK